MYTHSSMAANLLYSPGSSLSPEVLTSFVLPAHNQGVSSVPSQSLCPMVIIPTDYWLILYIVDYWLSSCTSTAISGSYLLHSALFSDGQDGSLLDCYIFDLYCLQINICSLNIAYHLLWIKVYTFGKHCVKDPKQFCCHSHLSGIWGWWGWEKLITIVDIRVCPNTANKLLLEL